MNSEKKVQLKIAEAYDQLKEKIERKNRDLKELSVMISNLDENLLNHLNNIPEV